jgi:PAS domain-containing protein
VAGEGEAVLFPAETSQDTNSELIRAAARIAELEAELAILRSKRDHPVSIALPAPSFLIESITDAFVALDPDFRYVWVNAEAEKLTGISRDQLLGEVIWDEFPGVVGSILEEKCR